MSRQPYQGWDVSSSCTVAHFDGAGNPIPCPDALRPPDDPPPALREPARAGCAWWVLAVLAWWLL